MTVAVDEQQVGPGAGAKALGWTEVFAVRESGELVWYDQPGEQIVAEPVEQIEWPGHKGFAKGLEHEEPEMV